MSYNADDPDFQYLALDRRKLLAEAPPYDAKKNCWIPDEKEGFTQGEIVSTTGDDVKVLNKRTMQEETVKKDKIQQMNPPKYWKIEDMANMTYLNEASVLNNLRDRYISTLIYTYSGLFCVAINPFKRLPIYGMNVVEKYKGRKKTEVPPHLFNVADNAYSNMLQDRENQSMLITGESGAGKTENTKKVISYFAMVANMMKTEEEKKKEAEGGANNKGSLEDQIVQANPVLEAYGNAKTTRNNNSSRFGKFIRIHFGPTGRIAGCDIETYLLEKSRVTYQQPGVERNYHVFYQLLSDKEPEYKEKLLITPDPGLFFFINQGCLTVDGMDDQEEMQAMNDAFKVLGFNEDEKISLYKATCCILHLGEIKFKQRPREEQAEADGTAEAEKASFLLGVNTTDFLNAVLKPKVKVGSEMVTKGQNKEQANFGIHALVKSLYSRMFDWLVARVNETLDVKARRQYFIGVLDIAGFEIFEYNTFEQLCINYTNERLQQFFNHHMFVLEQEEYKKEGINWTFIDFGMDLAACIELIEKPMGILSILNEETMFPKASDKTFLAKLYENHMGKSNNFGKPKPNKALKMEPHFELYHYAGTVGYNIAGWLDKNKDPINDTVVSVLGASKDPLVSMFFTPKEDPNAAKGGKGGKKKGGMQTIAKAHQENLNKLMKTLYTTHPHFVRCIIPNEIKTGGIIDSGLVMNQLQCNGVLEGIRICRKGFPNRMIYSEFKQRYSIIAPNAIPAGFVDGKEVTSKVLAAIQLDENDYRIGNTKVFFRAGVLGQLEDIRDERLSKIIALFQAWIRGYVMRKSYKKLQDQRKALDTIQRNIRSWLAVKNWQWMKLYYHVKPLLSQAAAEDEMKQKEAEFAELKENFEKTEKLRKELEEQNVTLAQAKNDLVIQLQTEQDSLAEAEERVQQLVLQHADFEAQIKEMEERIGEGEGATEELEAKKKKLEGEIGNLKNDIQDMELNLQKSKEENKAAENKIKVLNDEMAKQDESIAKLTKEKKAHEDTIAKTQDALAAEEDKVNHLNKLKQKMEGTIDELEDNLEREKKQRGDVEKVKRKLETDLKQTQETVEELDRIKRDLEDSVKRKEGEISGLNGKLEDEQNLVAQLQKKIKELQRTIEELEQELEQERATRSKVEKQRNELNRELEDMAGALDEASGATASQVDMNKKRESEINKLKRDLEEQAMQAEQQLSVLKKKSTDAQNDLADQLDSLTKVKSKIEKERNALKGDFEDAQSQLEMVTKGKQNAERIAKSLEGQLAEVNAKLEEASRNINDLGSAKGKAQSENADLIRQLEEAESSANQLAKAKANLTKQLDDAKASLEDESRARSKVQSDLRNLQADMDQMRDSLEEEAEGRADLQRQLQKAAGEAAEWRRKCESGEGGASSAELEDLKRKLTSKLMDVESQLDDARSKQASTEKVRNRLQGELDDCSMELERVQSLANNADKKQRAFDKALNEWKSKNADLQRELDEANGQVRANAAEVFRLRGEVDDMGSANDNLKRENRNLADEVAALGDAGDSAKATAEMQKMRRRLEMEKEELQLALEDAQGALEAEENKCMRLRTEMANAITDISRPLQEKEDEMDAMRKMHARAIDGLQNSLENESRAKAEAQRVKKKLEQDINELEIALDGANRHRAEAEKNYKKHVGEVRELQMALEEEQREKAKQREQYAISERRANALGGEVANLQTALDSAERARKAAENELHDAADRVSELTGAQSAMQAAKRKMGNDLQSMQRDLEDQANMRSAAEEAAKRAMSDAARLAEELRQAQDQASHIERMRRTLEGQNKELSDRLDEAEANQFRGGKRMVGQLEARVRELEEALDEEQRRHAETSKGLSKYDRRIKELAFTVDEDRKTKDRLKALIDGQNTKLKTYKRQVEEAEEIAATNLAKYRKLHAHLEETEERCELAESTLTRMRGKSTTRVINIST